MQLFTRRAVFLWVFFWTVVGHFPDIFRRDNTGHVSDSIAAHGDPEPTRQKSVLASILYKPPPPSLFFGFPHV